MFCKPKPARSSLKRVLNFFCNTNKRNFGALTELFTFCLCGTEIYRQNETVNLNEKRKSCQKRVANVQDQRHLP